MYASWKQIQLMAKLNPADSSLIADIDVWITNGRFYFLNDLQEEWMSFDWVVASGSNFVYSNLVRWLSQTADPVTAWTWLTWLAGNIWTLVQMHDQMADTKTSNTWTWTQTVPDIRFSWTTTSWLRVKSLTTAQRNALTAVNWDIVYDSTEWVHYQYIGGAWTTFATWSTPNASTTAAGKVELATDAEITAGTATWWTGASLVLTPEQQKKSISLKWAWTTFWDTDEIAVNVSWTDLRITWANLRESIPASTTAKGTVELATDAETITWTDTTRYISPNSARLALWAIEPWTTNTYLEANTERTSSSDTYTKVKEFLVKRSWNFTVNFDLKASLSATSIVNARIYKNWTAVWTERSSSSTSYASYAENFEVAFNDLIQLYYKSNTWTNALVRNFNMKYDLISWMTAWTVNTD